MSSNRANCASRARACRGGRRPDGPASKGAMAQSGVAANEHTMTGIIRSCEIGRALDIAVRGFCVPLLCRTATVEAARSTSPGLGQLASRGGGRWVPRSNHVRRDADSAESTPCETHVLNELLHSCPLAIPIPCLASSDHPNTPSTGPMSHALDCHGQYPACMPPPPRTTPRPHKPSIPYQPNPHQCTKGNYCGDACPAA